MDDDRPPGSAGRPIPAYPFPPRGARAAALPPRPTRLIGREEQDVAALIARGLTNREIADRPVLSVRTVDRHVGNILSKLRLRTRAQVGAWLTDQREERRLTAFE